ncbi:methyltransferase domain-containing protein [Pseudarthrobacter sp. NPDC058362]|uniref:methyltransferase domain-containing protein n=1 Tax=Pseudarthrobacter sp. NPDC058362 TaxID=3346458 RepID=UPI0036607866
MPDAALPLLCPVCCGPLSRAGVGAAAARTLSCASGHSFDAARQGYFNFLVGKGTPFEPDSAAMVEARVNFLSRGHYLPLARAVAAAVVPSLGEHPAVLDSGTGTGHYLRAVLDASAAAGRPAAALGLDISKFALRRAARLNPEALNVVWDVWRPLPLADDSVDAVTVVFAPRNPAEFARVLRPGGRLVVVTPRPGHLNIVADLTGMLGIEESKEDRLGQAMAEHFDTHSAAPVDIPLELSRRDAADLALMGPAGHHSDRESVEARLAGVPEPLQTGARFQVTVFAVR